MVVAVMVAGEGEGWCDRRQVPYIRESNSMEVGLEGESGVCQICEGKITAFAAANCSCSAATWASNSVVTRVSSTLRQRKVWWMCWRGWVSSGGGWLAYAGASSCCAATRAITVCRGGREDTIMHMLVHVWRCTAYSALERHMHAPVVVRGIQSLSQHIHFQRGVHRRGWCWCWC